MEVEVSDYVHWSMSSQIRQLIEESNLTDDLMTPSALRLACQERLTKLREITEEKRNFHRNCFANRAILECINREAGKRAY